MSEARRLADKLEISYAAAYRRLNPEKTRAWNAASNAKRGPDRWYTECSECGRRISYGYKRCQFCIGDEQAAARQDWAWMFRDLRLKGATNVEIARMLGVDAQFVGNKMCRLRKKGFDIPPSPHFRKGRL